jgi:hypothetical protein
MSSNGNFSGLVIHYMCYGHAKVDTRQNHFCISEVKFTPFSKALFTNTCLKE